MAKILVVDDETDLEVLIKQKFRQKIREHKYEFLFAINGKHALEQLELNEDVDIVLSDINMPEMDGLTLLSKINEQNTLLKAVIVSAYGDMENIRTAMNRGAFDFIQRRGVFQRGGIAELFAETGSAHDAPHDFCVSRFWYVADENDLPRRERFAELGGERVF